MNVLALIEQYNRMGFEKTQPKESVTYINGVMDIKDKYQRGTRLILDSDLVYKMADDMSVLDLVHADDIFIYVQDRIVSINDEENLLTLKDALHKEKRWLAVKKINQVLLNIDFLKKRAKQYGKPSYIQLETSSYCNAQCIMCSHYYTHNKGAKHLKKEMIYHLADEMVNCNTVSLNGMGEPFLHPDICELIDQYAQYGAQMATNTNLTVVNEKIMKQIRDHFAWIEISCDGADDYVYNGIRKNLSFQKFKENLKKLKEECPNIRKHLTMVVMRQNVHHMEEIIEIAAEHGIAQVSFSNMWPNMIIGNAKDVMTNYPDVLRYFTQRAYEKGKACGLEVSIAIDLGEPLAWEDVKDEFEAMKSEEDFKNEKEINEMIRISEIVEEYKEEHSILEKEAKPSNVRCSGICDWILERVYIDLEGNTCMCCSKQLFRTGSVDKNTSLSEVWNGEYYKKLREMFYAGVLPESCLGCGLIENHKLDHLRVPDMKHFHEEAAFRAEKRKLLNDLIEEKI
ncbi:MAG: radical SAM protein [Schaedlerella sp.]|nr:radical SAM protein [Schaedlerella sp.]